MERQPFLHHRCDEQQGRDELRTDVARHLQFAARQLMTADEERREAFLPPIADVGTHHAQGVDQQSYGSVAHALGAGDGMFAGSHSEVSGHKPHGRSCRLNIDDRRHILQRCHDDTGVVAIGQVVG